MDEETKTQDANVIGADAATKLQPNQLRAIDALLAGASVADAADAAGVDRSTIYRWQADPNFEAVYNRGLLALQQRADGRLWSMQGKIFDAIETALDDGNVEVAMQLSERMGLLTGERPTVGPTDADTLRLSDTLDMGLREDLVGQIHHARMQRTMMHELDYSLFDRILNDEQGTRQRREAKKKQGFDLSVAYPEAVADGSAGSAKGDDQDDDE